MNVHVHVPESRKTLIDFRLFVKSRHISIVHSCIQRTRDFERSLFVCLLWVCEFFIFLFFNNFIYFMAVTTQTDFKIFNLEYHKKVSKVEHTCLLAILYFTVLYIVLGFVTLIFSQKGLTKHYSSASLEPSCRTKYLRGVKKAPTFNIFTRFF